MPKSVVIAGQVIDTPDGVLEVYRPPASTIPGDEWGSIRPLVVTAVAAARYGSPSAALLAMQYTARLVVWARRLDMELDAETILIPEHVERFVASQLRHMSTTGQASILSNLRRVARAGTRTAPWRPPATPYRRVGPIAPPYTAGECEGFWEAAETQATELGERVLTVILTLGLGAGLKPAELLTISSAHVRGRDDERLWVIVLPDRTVPVLHDYTTHLTKLCRTYPDGPLIGPHRSDAKHPLGVLRKNIRLPAFLPPLRCAQLRTTWMQTVLTHDVRISEFMKMAGTVSAKALECIAPNVPGRWVGDEYLIKGAGYDAAP